MKLIRYLEERSIRCIIPTSETLRQGVRNECRKKVKNRYEDDRYYRRVYKQNRYKVERLLGNVKMLRGDRDNTRIYELARLFVMVRFTLWNLMMILKFYFFAFSCLSAKTFVIHYFANFQTLSFFNLIDLSGIITPCRYRKLIEKGLSPR